MKFLLLALVVALLPSSVGAYPITGSERKTFVRQSQYRDGYQVNGAGTVYSYYRESTDGGVTFGAQQELKLDDAEVMTRLANKSIMLEGYDETAKTWFGYYGNGNNLSTHEANYVWPYGYELTFDGNFIRVDVQISFDWTNSGETNEQVQNAHMSLWEQNIEHWWSDRYEVVKDDKWHFPIFFDVTYDGYSDNSYDQHVSVLPGSGRANVQEWYLTDNAQTNAHEFGHMLGLYDEYWLGAIDPVTWETDYQNLMGANIGNLNMGAGLEDYYFSAFMGWLDTRDADETQTYRLRQIDEPGMLGLLAIGMGVLVRIRRTRKAA